MEAQTDDEVYFNANNFNIGSVRVSMDEYPSLGGTPIMPSTPTRRSIESMVRGALNIGNSFNTLNGTDSGIFGDVDHPGMRHGEETRLSMEAAIGSPFISYPLHLHHFPPDHFNHIDVEAPQAPMEDFMEVGAVVRKHSVATNDKKLPLRVDLKFIDVTYKVIIEGGAKWTGKVGIEKQILHGITGHVSSGEMLALMGPSGSGKTTFLNLLGFRKSDRQNSNGSILYNGLPYSKNLKRRMGFVAQDDVLFPHLSVRETLTFSALLRLPRALTRTQKMKRVEQVIMQLGLQRCSDTMIGNQFLRGVSGGERKRVCIGQEILINPSLILLDEPTSGLDSTTTLRLITLLQSLAHEGRTVVTTIHQPSSRAFHMFDKLLLLSEGRSAYFGQARGAMAYFESIGFTPLLLMNPADFLLDLCSGCTADISLPSPNVLLGNINATNNNSTSNTTKCVTASIPATPSTMHAKDVKQYVIESWDRKQVNARKSKITIDKEQGKYENQRSKNRGKMENIIVMVDEEWTTTWWEQFMILLVRGFKERRHDYLSPLRIFQVIASAILAGFLWWHSNPSTPQQLQDQLGLIFFIAVFWAYLPLFTAVFTFPLERAVLVKESASDMYRLSAYFMARTLGDLPLDLFLPFVFMIIIYFMANLLRTPIAFCLSLMAIFLTVIASQGFGLLIGATMVDVQKATTFSSIIILAFMLVGGFFVQNIPPFVSWIKYFSLQAHTYNILIQIQYADYNAYDCASQTGCQNISTSPALHNSSLHGALQSTLALLAMIFGYRILTFVALRRMRTKA